MKRCGPERAAERAGDAGEAVGAIGDPQLVRHDDAQRLGKAERDDGEVVAAQAHGNQRHQDAEQRRGKRAGGDADDDGQAEPQGQQPGHIGADREEADEAQIDQPGHAPDDIHAERHQGVDAGRDADGDEIVLHASPQYARAPRMPRGRSVRTSRMATKADGAAVGRRQEQAGSAPRRPRPPARRRRRREGCRGRPRPRRQRSRGWS